MSTYTPHAQRLLDQTSPGQLRARQEADRRVAGFIRTESVCEEHGVIDAPNEGTHCPICGEPCDMRAVCR